jgi:hypothetical protein
VLVAGRREGTDVATRKSRGAKGGTAAGAPPGSGANFKKVAASAAKSGARDPDAVAAAVGRRKYGKAAFQKMAAAGRKRKGGSSKGK